MEQITLGHSPPKLHFHNVEYTIKKEFYDLMGPTFTEQKTTRGADYVILTNKTFYWCNKELSGTYIAKYVMDNVPNKITGREEISNVVSMALSKDPASVALGRKLILRCDLRKVDINQGELREACNPWRFLFSEANLLSEFYYYLLRNTAKP